MKKNYFLLMFFIFTYGFSQGNSTLSYYVTPNDGESDMLVDESGAKITVCNTLRGFIKLEKGKCVFEVYRISRNGSNTTKHNSEVIPAGETKCITAADTYKDLYIDLEPPQKYGDPYYAKYLKFTALNYGVSAIAARFRGDDNNGRKVVSTGLGAAFNIGFSRGYAQITQRKINHWFVNGGAFLGLASVELNSSNVTNSSGWGEVKRTNATVNYGPCLIFARNNLGVVFTYGWERALGADGERWIFNHKPWFGIGVTSSLGFF